MAESMVMLHTTMVFLVALAMWASATRLQWWSALPTAVHTAGRLSPFLVRKLDANSSNQMYTSGHAMCPLRCLHHTQFHATPCASLSLCSK